MEILGKKGIFLRLLIYIAELPKQRHFISLHSHHSGLYETPCFLITTCFYELFYRQKLNIIVLYVYRHLNSAFVNCFLLEFFLNGHIEAPFPWECS